MAPCRDWPVLDRYIDDDRSAYSGKPRPERRRLLDDIRAGTVDAVIVYDLDRLPRQPKELECPACVWCGYVEASVEGRYNRYRLVDERVREIIRLGEAIVRDNAERLTSCLVLGTEATGEATDN